MIRHASVLAILLICACSSEPSSALLDLPGARNEALRDAARTHDLPVEWLAAIAYQQGRFEPADRTTDDMPGEVNDPADELAEDTPLDDTTDPPITEDGAAPGVHELPDAWGLMYLSDAQIDAAAQLTGASVDALRADVATNIDGAAALLAAARDAAAGDLRAGTLAFLGYADDVETGQLALVDLDDTLRDGFDLTTFDGERLALTGADPQPEAIEAVAPGKYPARQWIPSPNFSSRLGLNVRFIVVHDIEGTMAGAISVFKRTSSQASAHYITRASDGHIVQMVREGNNAWHAGHGWFNRHSVGIEHEGFAHRKNGGGFYTDRQYRASARLACAIAHRYSIPVNRKHIFGHMNVPSNLSSHTLCSDARGIAGECGGVSHHSDPGRFWNWTKYMTLIRGCVAAAG
jgi:N-acetyl-anhydromuramyl-L-alanine amidase AmpD